MKNKGFTLIELLAVLVLLGLIMAIALPNAMKINKKVKDKTFDTKIELIEDAASNLGQTNISLIKKGTSFSNNSEHHTCTFNYDNNKNVTSVIFNTRSYSEDASLTNTDNRKEYWCSRLTVADLVKYNSLSWDLENQCDGSCTSYEKEHYDKIIINPVNQNIINNCHLYIYYRNNRVYAYFDKGVCSNTSDTPNNNGNAYKQLSLVR